MVSENRPQSVFVDTNVLVSFYNKRDSLHKKALKVFKNLYSKKAKLIISNYILLEVYTILSQKAGKKKAIEFGKLVRKEKPFLVKWVEEKDDDKVWDVFQKVKDKNISYVDCNVVALVVSGYYELCTFDQKLQKLTKDFSFKLYKT